MQLSEVKLNKIVTITPKFTKEQFDEMKLIKDDAGMSWEEIIYTAIKNYEVTKPC